MYYRIHLPNKHSNGFVDKDHYFISWNIPMDYIPIVHLILHANFYFQECITTQHSTEQQNNRTTEHVIHSHHFSKYQTIFDNE